MKLSAIHGPQEVLVGPFVADPKAASGIIGTGIFGTESNIEIGGIDAAVAIGPNQSAPTGVADVERAPKAEAYGPKAEGWGAREQLVVNEFSGAVAPCPDHRGSGCKLSLMKLADVDGITMLLDAQLASAAEVIVVMKGSVHGALADASKCPGLAGPRNVLDPQTGGRVVEKNDENVAGRGPKKVAGMIGPLHTRPVSPV